MTRLILSVFWLFIYNTLFAQHPVCFITKGEAATLQRNVGKNPLLTASYNDIKNEVDNWLNKEVDVPFPKDPAGGYTHDKHKANYTLMFNSGLLYELTGDTKYAKLVKDMFMKYAVLNPTLKAHPQATSAFPGHLFWQALNDANWLVYTGLAFDCIHDYLTPAERKIIADGAFKPEVDFFTKDLKNWFNLIHNHAVWACAGVGIVGIATDNQDYVNMALMGTEKDGKSGFLAQMNGLFSPDGYYNEGPYYTRYAILPFYLFANAVNNTKPDRNIFHYRNSILQKALNGALQQTNLNGGFYSYNDALKEKTFISNEVVEALNIAWKVYGEDAGWLTVAKQQGRVTLSTGGMKIAEALSDKKNIDKYYPYKSIEFTDGPKGDEGGVSILRTGKDDSLTTLIFKYSSQGMAHGHFDKLNINIYDKGNEILQDYGAARYINIEQKWGGRYLPETKSYAQQTIAHNTVTVDETSHFNAVEAVGDQYHSDKIFSDVGNQSVQVVSAMDDKAYGNLKMYRTIYLLQLPGRSNPVFVDLFKVKSNQYHQYDLPFNYLGTVMDVNTKYKRYTTAQSTLGTKNGYQFLWKEAEAKASCPMSQFTFLNNNTFYTVSSLTDDSTKLFFTRIGANDPNFNLRSDPSYILRRTGTDKTFVNVIEAHGNFNPVTEITTDSYSAIKNIELTETEEFTTINVTVSNKKLMIVQCNKEIGADIKHSIKTNDKTLDFTGPFVVLFDNKTLK